MHSSILYTSHTPITPTHHHQTHSLITTRSLLPFYTFPSSINYTHHFPFINHKPYTLSPLPHTSSHPSFLSLNNLLFHQLITKNPTTLKTTTQTTTNYPSTTLSSPALHKWQATWRYCPSSPTSEAPPPRHVNHLFLLFFLFFYFYCCY